MEFHAHVNSNRFFQRGKILFSEKSERKIEKQNFEPNNVDYDTYLVATANKASGGHG